MSLLNEIVKLLGSPTWGGIGVLVSTLLAVIALLRTRRSPSKPDPSQQRPIISAPLVAALTPADQGTTSLLRTSVPTQKRRRRRRRKSSKWAVAYDYDDPTGGVPDEFLPPSYWN